MSSWLVVWWLLVAGTDQLVRFASTDAHQVLLLGEEVRDWRRFDSLFLSLPLLDGGDAPVEKEQDALASGKHASLESLLLVREECYEYEVRVEVYFGLDVKCRQLDGVAVQISDREFEAFLDREVTPRFPQGFSVLDVPLGQWFSPARRSITKERSKVMLLLMPDTPENNHKLRAIAHSYTATFHQDTVMISKSPLFSYCFVGAASPSPGPSSV